MLNDDNYCLDLEINSKGNQPDLKTAEFRRLLEKLKQIYDFYLGYNSVLFCHPKEVTDKCCLMKVREIRPITRTLIGPDKIVLKYKMCPKLKTCDSEDLCNDAHCDEELTIWKMINEANVNGFSIFNSLKEHAKQNAIPFYNAKPKPKPIMNITLDNKLICNYQLIGKQKKCTLHFEPSTRIYAVPVDDVTIKIFIRNRKQCQHAFDKDIVIVEITQCVNDECNQECKYYGKVVRIVEQRFEPVGKRFICFADPHARGNLVPLDNKIPHIRSKKSKYYGNSLIQWRVNGDKVNFVRVLNIEGDNYRRTLYTVWFLKWDEQCTCPLGAIVDCFQATKSIDCGFKILDIQYGVRRQYPHGVNIQSKEIHKTFSSTNTIRRLPIQYRKNREDLTNLLCFTIDSSKSDALDDALSIEKFEDFFKVGVHIADVSSFIPKQSKIDVEAFKRGQSVCSKNGDRIVHMMPRNISENVFSLLPKRECAVVSLFFIIDKEGKIRNEDTSMQQSIIVSSHRLTYENVEQILSDNTVSDDTECLPTSLKNLYFLATKLKQYRLGLYGSIAIEYDRRNYFKADRLVSEWMIMANKTVAEKLCKLFPNLCPLRKQHEPDANLLKEWLERFTHQALHSLTYQHLLNEFRGGDSHDSPHIAISNNTWESVSKARLEGNYYSIEKLVCTEKQHPYIALSMIANRKIQNRACYELSGFSKTDTYHHYGLNLNFYTHFTSPIRRYIDIVVHRLLLSDLNKTQCPYDIGELEKICKNCMEISTKFKGHKREVYSFSLGAEFYSQPKQYKAIISKLDDSEATLEIPDLINTVDSVTFLRYNYLQLQTNPERIVHGLSKLRWKKKIYNYDEFIRVYLKNTHESKMSTPDVIVPCTYWSNLLESLASKNHEKINAAIDVMQNARLTLNDVQLNSPSKNSSTIQNRWAQVSVEWTTSTILNVQLSADIHSGLLTPLIQLILLTPTLNLCIEHERDRSLCFTESILKHSKDGYDDISDYQKIWLPLLQADSAYSVPANEAIRLNNVNSRWTKDERGRISVTLKIDKNFCQQINLSFTRTEYKNIHVDLKRLIKLDYFCIEVNITEENYIWVSHCASVKAYFPKENDQYWKLTCCLIHSSTVVPDSVFEKNRVCSIEILKMPDSHRRMQTALLQLDKTSMFIQDIFLGNIFSDQQSANDYQWSNKIMQIITNVESTQIYTSNKDQTDAILHSLTHPFSLIWGPPGTGKTATAVTLACVNAHINEESFSTNSNERKKEILLFCAPSNKAINVAARIFLRKNRNGIKVIRMYSRTIEQAKYPLPVKDHNSKHDRHLDKNIDSIALHVLIRQNSNTFSKRLLEMDNQVKDICKCLASGQKVTEEMLALSDEYLKLIKLAEYEEIKLRCNILLCTCVVATEKRLQLSQDGDYVISQVIIDEAGMCHEMESLIPIVSTGCSKLTLVGDHRQLAPIVKGQSKKYGFDSSLFEKYANAESGLMKMLKVHYRMHMKIAQFPSYAFYDDELVAADNDVQHKTDELPIWPNRTDPVVFCNCNGVEQYRVVTTEDSSTMSYYNTTEAVHVVRIVTTLINLYKISPERIGIFSQYRAQVLEITSLLKKEVPEQIFSKINVLTTVRTQGDEWDYTIFSTVRSCSEAEIDDDPSVALGYKYLGIVADKRQINVAITRAKKGLIILGNMSLLSTDTNWKEMLSDYRKRGLIVKEAASFLKIPCFQGIFLDHCVYLS